MIVELGFRDDVQQSRAQRLLLSKRASPAIDFAYAVSQQTTETIFSRADGGDWLRSRRKPVGKEPMLLLDLTTCADLTRQLEGFAKIGRSLDVLSHIPKRLPDGIRSRGPEPSDSGQRCQHHPLAAVTQVVLASTRALKIKLVIDILLPQLCSHSRDAVCLVRVTSCSNHMTLFSASALFAGQ